MIAETRGEAERQAVEGFPRFQVLSSREMDFSGLPPLRSGPLPKHWLVVVAHEDPEEEAKLPQQENPETDSERHMRQLYLTMATDPGLLSEGTYEEFDCPGCGARVKADLPPERKVDDAFHTTCGNCRSHLSRPKGVLDWQVIEHPPYPTCVFCGAAANSREHVVPHWISKRLGIRVFLSARDAFVVGSRARQQEVSFASYRARVMCSGCNEHFKHLEDEVIPLLVPMARGFGVGLGTESQELLALWANKTALALAGASDELRETLPERHGEAIRAGRVADDTWVGFFPWRGSPMIVTGESTISTPELPARRHETYAAILTFAEIGVYVTGFKDPVDPPEAIHADKSPLRQLWPPNQELIGWPPPAPALTRGDLAGLLNVAPLRLR